MKREIKNDGVYLEIASDGVVASLDALKKAEIVVITQSRLELAGEDLNRFLSNFDSVVASFSESDKVFYDCLNSSQKFDFVFRTIMCR